MTRTIDDLVPILRQAVRCGLLTLEQAFDVDALADGLVAQVVAGELTEEQATERAARQAVADGEAMLAARRRRRGS